MTRGFLAWTRTKPADERYCYFSKGECALAQFLVATGRAERPYVNFDWWLDDLRGYHSIGDGLAIALFVQPHTFGALVTRLEALCPPQSNWGAVDAYLTDIEQVIA